LQVRKKASENCGEGLLEASVSMPTRRRFHTPSGGPAKPGWPATPLQLAAATPGSRCGQARFDHERVAAIPRRRCAKSSTTSGSPTIGTQNLIINGVGYNESIRGTIVTTDSAAVPEIDPAMGGSALSLVAGVLAMIEQRRRRATLVA
jgi:hypothetical protein